MESMTCAMMAHGEGNDEQGNLFNITWFAFVKRQQ